MNKFNLFRNKKRFLIFFFFTILLLASPTYKGISNNEVIVEDQTIKPIETSFNLDALPFPNSRIIRVAIYDEPNNTETSYTGGHSGVETNNVSKVVELLSVKPNIHISILTNADISLHVLTTASFDVLILPDNHPREWILDMIHDFWLGGGGILALDGSALFFNHLGILPPEAIGTDGYGVYWDYTADGFNFTTRHPVSKAFSVDAYVEPPGFYGHFGWDWSALSGSAVAADITPLAHDFSDANVITALAFDPTDRGGKIVTIGHDLTYNYNPEIDPLIVDSIDWLAPRPKGRILFDYTHHPYYSIDVWDDLAHWTGEYETYRDNLVSREYTFDKLYPVTSGQNISYPKLEPYDMFIVVAPDVGYNYTVDEIAAIEAWVIDGGSLFVVGENPNSMPDEVFIINQLLTPYDLRINDGNVVQTSYEGEIPHPITEDATQLLMTSNGYINITGDAFGIWYDTSFANIVMAGDIHGNGRIILTADINWFDDTYIGNGDNERMSINIANWLTATKADILLFTEWSIAINYYLTPAALALNDLGLKYHLSFDFEFFNFTLHERPWRMVIIANPNDGAFVVYADDIIDFIDSGGHLILSTYVMDSDSAHPVWAKLGTVYNSDYTSNPDLFIWDAGHPIFTQPHDYTEDRFEIGTAFADDGDTVTVLSNATGIAGFTASETAGEAFITLRNDEQTLFNSYLIDTLNSDYDDSTYQDNFELWRNEIAFMMRPKLDLVISVPLENYVGDSVTLTADITNLGLSGCPIGYIDLALAPDVSSTDDLEQNYTLPEGANEIITWSVTSTVVQNVTISFEASYTGFLGTAYGTGVLYFDIHFLAKPPGLDLPWYYYVAAGGGLLLLILIIVIIVSVRKKKKTPTR